PPFLAPSRYGQLCPRVLPPRDEHPPPDGVLARVGPRRRAGVSSLRVAGGAVLSAVRRTHRVWPRAVPGLLVRGRDLPLPDRQAVGRRPLGEVDGTTVLGRAPWHLLFAGHTHR